MYTVHFTKLTPIFPGAALCHNQEKTLPAASLNSGIALAKSVSSVYRYQYVTLSWASGTFSECVQRYWNGSLA